MNKKKILTTLSIAAVAIVSGYGGMKAYQSHDVYPSDLLSQNIEALAKGGDIVCNNNNGYKQWNISGSLFSKKKEFYDCCFILREGYKPSGNCN
jgi:hypothetical protein